MIVIQSDSEDTVIEVKQQQILRVAQNDNFLPCLSS
jgi:hypothetical protein